MSDTGATLVDESYENIQDVLEKEEVKDNSLVDINEIPQWLNRSLLEDVLCNFFKTDDIRVKSLKVMHLGGKGESFTSMMYRVGTYYVHQNSPENVKFFSCILKTLPQSDVALEKLGSENYNVQNKEMTFYKDLVPKLEEILSTIGENGKTFPGVMAVYKDLSLIVLEDLSEKNFVMQNRIKGLDMNHVKLSLKALARMHAASVVLNERENGALKNFDTGFYTRKTDAFHVFFNSGLEAATNEVAKWTEWDQSAYFAEKLRKLQKHFVENGRKAFDCDERDFNCLNHGDLWTNNVLYCYNGSEAPKEAIILDYQYFFYGSAALDLHFFLITSVHNQMRLKNMDQMVQFYYYEVKDLLKRLNYDMKKFPTLQNFQMQVLKKLSYAFSSCIINFPVQLSEDDDADFEVLVGADERSKRYKARAYANPRFKEVAIKMLPIFDAKGVLDEM